MAVVIIRDKNKESFSEQEVKNAIYKGLTDSNWKRNTEYDWDLDKEVEIENEWVKTTSKGYNSFKVYTLDDRSDFQKYGYIAFDVHESNENGDTYTTNGFSLKVSSLEYFNLDDRGMINLVFDIDGVSNVINLG